MVTNSVRLTRLPGPTVRAADMIGMAGTFIYGSNFVLRIIYKRRKENFKIHTIKAFETSMFYFLIPPKSFIFS